MEYRRAMPLTVELRELVEEQNPWCTHNLLLYAPVAFTRRVCDKRSVLPKPILRSARGRRGSRSESAVRAYYSMPFQIRLRSCHDYVSTHNTCSDYV